MEARSVIVRLARWYHKSWAHLSLFLLGFNRVVVVVVVKPVMTPARPFGVAAHHAQRIV